MLAISNLSYIIYYFRRLANDPMYFHLLFSSAFRTAMAPKQAPKCFVRMYSASANRSTTATTSTAASRVQLAFEVHNPKLPESRHFDLSHRSPILFLHGFLGSKRENRHVSRYHALLNLFFWMCVRDWLLTCTICWIETSCPRSIAAGFLSGRLVDIVNCCRLGNWQTHEP